MCKLLHYEILLYAVLITMPLTLRRLAMALTPGLRPALRPCYSLTVRSLLSSVPLTDFFEFCLSTRKFREVEEKGESPGVRENNGVVLYKTALYIFGGYNGSTWLNDFHEFSLETESWRLVDPNGFCPAARFGYVSVVHEDSFILFGGYDGSTWLNDMYEYDFLVKKWSPIEATGAVPSIRSCPSWTKHENSVYVLGGYDGVQRMNDFFEYRCDTQTWVQIPNVGSVPSPRYFHSSTMYGNSMITFGGYNGTERLNDMYLYSFDRKRWRVVETGGDIPSGRSSLVAQVYQNSLYVFGGYNGQVVLNDFYEYRFENVAIPPPTLTDDLRKLINNKEFSDITFIVDGKPIHATRAHLAVRSEHFRALLYGGMRESEAGGEVVLQDVGYECFMKMLEFLYTDTVGDISPHVAVPLLITSERYLLERLKRLCEDRIQKSITEVNVVSIFMAAHQHNAMGLKEICLEFITANLEEVKHTQGFHELKAEPDLLVSGRPCERHKTAGYVTRIEYTHAHTQTPADVSTIRACFVLHGDAISTIIVVVVVVAK